MGKWEKFINSDSGVSVCARPARPQGKGDVFNLPGAQGSGEWQSHPGCPEPHTLAG